MEVPMEDANVARTFKWSSVGGDPSVNFQVLQLGYRLYFFEDGTPMAENQKHFAVDLRSNRVEDSDIDQVTDYPIDVTFGRGHMFVVGQSLEPFYVTYDAANDTIQTNAIAIKERDFEGVEDGTDNATTPPTLSEQYNYNLQNSGWNPDDIAAFFTTHAKYPSKNMLYHMGYRREIATGFAEEDGTRQFSPEKLIAELFQDAPAPKGHFIRSPFNTQYVPIPSINNTYIEYTGMSLSPESPGSSSLTITTSAAHGVAIGEQVYLYNDSGTAARIQYYSSSSGIEPDPGLSIGSIDLFSPMTVTATPTATTLTVSVTLPADFISVSSYPTGILYNDTALIANPSGYVSDKRPSTVAFFAGRVWYAGTNYSKLGSKIFFSQVIESDAQYGRCYQVADPTDPNISDLLPTDGGVLNIPEISQVYKILPYSSSLVVFAANGVWEIGPGQSGYFTASSYSIRKIGTMGTDGAGSVVDCETVLVFWGKSSIYRIQPDTNQGFLVAENISAGVIDKLFNAVSTASKQQVQATYDPLYKRAIWVYSKPQSGQTLPSTRYNMMLIYDMRFEAFIKWRLSISPNQVCTILAIKDTDSESPEHNLKVVTLVSDDTVTIDEFTDTSFEDWGTTDYESYLLSGYDTAQSPTRYKNAPIVHVFTNKTETGYEDEEGNELIPERPGSLYMQARWDWADHNNSGKWGTSQQCYRHRRLYIPTGDDDNYDDGHPIIVTRNKVRGRGRCLHLKFSSESNKDAYILGWSTNFDVMTDN
jgi:hypothetical protein